MKPIGLFGQRTWSIPSVLGRVARVTAVSVVVQDAPTTRDRAEMVATGRGGVPARIVWGVEGAEATEQEVVALCHEVGHILAGVSVASIGAAFAKDGVSCPGYPNSTASIRALWKDEVRAWIAGRPIALELGVSPVVYDAERRRPDYLRTYRKRTMAHLRGNRNEKNRQDLSSQAVDFELGLPRRFMADGRDVG